jgi:FkbM family methyltransferase
MKIIFVESFDRKLWNGRVARYEKGVSGTHTSIIYLAEGLANLKQKVEIVSIYNNIKEEEYLGVKYTNFENFVPSTCDFIITTNNIADFLILEKIILYNKIIVVCHNEIFNLYHFGHLLMQHKENIIINYLSEFGKENIKKYQPLIKDFESMILLNSFDNNDLAPIHEKKENALCFFACVERGYKFACEIVKHLPGFVIYSNTYADEHRCLFETKEQIVQIEGSSKKHVFSCLPKCKYFLYPLINLENDMIHYDTFGYVVLEALLHGVVVVAPKIAIYEELYGDAIYYIETNDIIPQDDLKYWRKSNHNFGYPLLQRYVDAVLLLEKDEELREQYIHRGLSLKKKFSNKTISQKLFNILQNKKKLHLQKHLFDKSTNHRIPNDHINHLKKLKKEGFEPKVIYDIGCCLLQWTREASKIWPEAKIILFDAFEPARFLYNGYEYFIGCLSDTENKDIKFYQNDYFPSGNSYYREIGCENGIYFPEEIYVEMKSRTLDSVVKEMGFPLPDFVKIDVQGSEIDIIRGARETFLHTQKMIVELQHVEYNLGALYRDEAIDILTNFQSYIYHILELFILYGS